NHFQGRVSCPMGQDVPTSCAHGEACGNGESCVKAGTFLTACDPANNNKECLPMHVCDRNGKFCQCKADVDCPQTGPVPYGCDLDGKSPTVNQCISKVCHKPGNCQTECNIADADCQASNKGKACCIPGTDVPVTSPICGQCEASSHRAAEDSVYC